MNLPEQNLLVLLLPKESFNKYSDLVDLSYIKETYRELSHIYSTLFDLHERYDKDISMDELSAAFWAKYPDADKIIYGNLLKTLSGLTISPEVGQGILEDIKRRQGALKLSEKAFRVAQGLEDDTELQALMESWGTVDHKQAAGLQYVTHDLEELIEQSYSETGYRWRLDCLNKSLGSLRQGDFGFIFARPETGKTTFLASEITCFLCGQMGAPVVWFNNEEQGSKVMLRIYQAYFGVTTDQLLANPRRFRDEFLERTGDRFRLYDSATIHRKDIERIVGSSSPGLVVYDQIDKIKGFNNDREDLRLGSIYQWGRELAKGNHAAIGVCQADGTAEGVRYLTLDHVSNAKTAKQAEADWILGIGKSHDTTEENIRFLHISKNKLLGDKDTIPNLRHGRFEVLIKADVARYEDIVKYG
jgi:replicative DNA helicase